MNERERERERERASVQEWKKGRQRDKHTRKVELYNILLEEDEKREGIYIYIYIKIHIYGEPHVFCICTHFV